MDKLLEGYRLGQVVVSKKGKDAGSVYVIVGFLEKNRLALADAKRFNVSRPKSKNPKHTQRTQCFVEIAPAVDEGKDLDHGHLCRLLNLWTEGACKKSEQRGRAANGK